VCILQEEQWLPINKDYFIVDQHSKWKNPPSEMKQKTVAKQIIKKDGYCLFLS